MAVNWLRGVSLPFSLLKSAFGVRKLMQKQQWAQHENRGRKRKGEEGGRGGQRDLLPGA